MTESDRGDEARVVAFLEAAGRHLVLDADVLTVWRPVVKAAGRPGHERWRAARHLASQGTVPTAESIEAECLRRRERDARIAAAVEADATAHADAARAFVAEVRARSGAGPTWGELSVYLGWSRAYGKPRIERMLKRGDLRATGEERSLDLSTPASDAH